MTDEQGRDRGREETDAALDDERRVETGYGRDRDQPDAREVVPDRGPEREETDGRLVDERAITDGLDRMEESDAAIAKWRTSHADDDIGTTPARRRSDWFVSPWVNIAMIVLVVAWMAVVTSQVVISTSRIADINSRQIAGVQQQNDAQLCAQHDMVGAIKKIGLKLGLPVGDIVPPDVTGLECYAG